MCCSTMERNDNLRAWDYFDSLNSVKALDFMSSCDRKPLIGSRESPLTANLNGMFHREHGIPNLTSHYQSIDINPFHRENKYYNMLSTGYHSCVIPTETSPTYHHQPMHMLRQHEISKEEKLVLSESSNVEINSIPLKKRSAGKSDKPDKMKKPKKASCGPKVGGCGSSQHAKSAKKAPEVVINGIDMDISSIPIPICSCTGAPQQCYRWGFGGWQSACCTTGMSMYPLPMSTKRRGARIAGRKMSLGAFKKVLEKLAAEGYNFSNPIDLRFHWAKHGTNKFVTIR